MTIKPTITGEIILITKNNMHMITFCIPSKNNLRYLKSSIASIKKNSEQENDIIVYVDASSDGTLEWLQANSIKYLLNETDTPKGIAYAYNRCIEAAETDIVCMFHADMFMGKDFDKNILKHLKPKTVIAGTRIEPPLHPEGKEKIIKDFGMYPEDFTEEAFNTFVQQEQESSKDQVTYGIFAPWACYKSELVEIGLHDESFHSYQEDSDIFNRMILSGMECIQSRDALVYHLTCRGGQFQDGVERVTDNAAFHIMKENAARNYLRKWGNWVKNDEYQHPIIHPKYNVAFAVKNCNFEMLKVFEPWCDRIYIQDEMGVLQVAYCETEQKNTSYDLTKRVLTLGYNYPIGENDIVVEFDAKQFTQQSFNILQQLSEIIKQSGEVGQFELDIFKVTINSLTEYQNDLIVCKN
jgi:glycosyltransferase involved in cell wall biosynthesis